MRRADRADEVNARVIGTSARLERERVRVPFPASNQLQALCFFLARPLPAQGLSLAPGLAAQVRAELSPRVVVDLRVQAASG